jgi:hypothetical protein
MPAPRRIDYFRTFTTDPLGQIFMTGIVNVAPYNTVNLEIIQWPHAPVTMSVTCMMGKITGSTLAEELEHFPLGTVGHIHSYDVIGSEFSAVLTGGPPKTKVPIQAWLFLH